MSVCLASAFGDRGLTRDPGAAGGGSGVVSAARATGRAGGRASGRTGWSVAAVRSRGDRTASGRRRRSSKRPTRPRGASASPSRSARGGRRARTRPTACCSRRGSRGGGNSLHTGTSSARPSRPAAPPPRARVSAPRSCVPRSRRSRSSSPARVARPDAPRAPARAHTRGERTMCRRHGQHRHDPAGFPAKLSRRACCETRRRWFGAATPSRRALVCATCPPMMPAWCSTKCEPSAPNAKREPDCTTRRTTCTMEPRSTPLPACARVRPCSRATGVWA